MRERNLFGTVRVSHNLQDTKIVRDLLVNEDWK